MREPVFNATVQLGIVVRDLEATVRMYEDDYGIGPWQFQQIDLGDANDYREYGEPAERSNRVAFATVGGVAVAAPDFGEAVARAEREDGLMLRCKHSGVDIAYLDTRRDLGVVIEVFSGMPSDGAP
jgi:methylmalonyl-CoA/ethylmalonyl-CoA epimerase